MSDQASARVVILGGGVAGLTTATALRERLAPQDTITVVERSDTHVLGLSLLWVLRGWRTLDEVTARPWATPRAGIDLRRADVEHIDTDTRQVVTSAGSLPYDALVIALGAETHASVVPGLAEALTAGAAAEFYSPRGATLAHDRLAQLRGGRLVVAVAALPYRCPAAPWEAALLADDLLRETGVREDVELTVVTPEPQPMPVAGPEVGAPVTAMLHERRIATRFSAGLVAVEGSTLHLADGATIVADLALVVPPHRPPARVRELTGGGWLPVDPRTLALSDGPATVWALGDAALVPLPDGRPLPKAAVFARAQAITVADGVAAHLGRSQTVRAFDGVGHCYLETGAGPAARGAGDFYAGGGPQVTLEPPSGALHAAKEAEEWAWLHAAD